MNFKAIPTFRIPNEQQGKDYYIDFLGFSVDWEHRFAADEPIYMQVSLNGLVLHLSENIRFQPGAVVFVETTGIDEFHAELTGKESDYIVPPVAVTPWGTKQLEIEDPFGNWLRFNETL